MNKILLIIQREYLTRVKKKSFIIMTILGPLLMAALIVGAIYMSLNVEDKQKVLVVDEMRIFNNLKSSSEVQFEYSSQDLETVKKEFHSSDYTGILFIPQNVVSINRVQFYFKKQPGFKAMRQIENSLEEEIETLKLNFSKIDKDKYYSIKTNLNINTINFKEPGIEEKSNQEAGYVGFFFALLIYMFIFMYGVQVMRGVIEEKTSRIVEVIISSVKPFQLMLGKIIGVALVGLTQFLLWVILTGTITSVAQTFILKDKYNVENITETNMSTELMKEAQAEGSGKQKMNTNEMMDLISRINFGYMIAVFLFYFLGGYLLYSAMFAAIGAAVDNEADTQQFMLPVTIPLIFAFFIAQLSIQNPEGPTATWFSIIPFTSPIVMMIRVATVPFHSIMWELFLSMALLVITFLLTTWLAGRIYRTGILMYGKKVSYKELWKWLFYKG